jgi:ribosomal protein L29
MDSFGLNLTTDISVFSLVLTLILGICLIVTLRIYASYEKLNNQLTQLKNEFRAMNSGQLGMGRKIRKVSEEIANVETVQQQTNHHGTSEKVYEQAGLLLSRGATIEEVVESCEIAPAEAELIAIMSHSAPSFNTHKSESLVA